MDRHPLNIEPFGLHNPGGARCQRRAVCPSEIAACLVVITLVLLLAGPTGVAAGAGSVAGGVAETIGAVFDAGGFLRPSW